MSDAAAIAKAKAKLQKTAAAAYSKSKEKPSQVKKGGGVPAPIKGGASQFVGYEFGETEKSDPMFQLKFVILEPEEHAGRQFRLFHFINESQYSTVEDATDKLTSDVQLLGGEGCTAGTDSVLDLFPILDTISQDKPFMEFDSWVHTFGKNSKRKGEKENRVAITACIDQEYDPKWYEALLVISRNVVKVEDDAAGDPKPPTSRSRSQASTPTSTNGATPKAATPARGRAATPPPAAETPAPRASGRRAAAPPPEPEPQPEPDVNPDIPQVDDILGLEVDVETGKGRTKKVERQLWAVTVTAVDEAAGTVDVVDENGGVYEAIPFDELKDPPSP
jgi:hypothetical protein